MVTDYKNRETGTRSVGKPPMNLTNFRKTLIMACLLFQGSQREAQTEEINYREEKCKEGFCKQKEFILKNYQLLTW
jgi:hypothetical protein